jgi:hypothetical protein
MGNGAPRSNVIRTLKAHRVFVALEDEAQNLYALERESYLERKVFPAMVPMWLLNEFKRKLDIPIHHFWNPEAAESTCNELGPPPIDELRP